MNVVCVGDCGVDRYVDLGLDRPGGITLNFAVHARECFEAADTVTVVTAIGTDPESRLVEEALAALPLKCETSRREGRTSIQYIALEPSGEKNFLEYHQGVLGEFRLGEEERALVARADLMVAPAYRQILGFFESVMAAPSAGLRAVDFADIADADGVGTDIIQSHVDRIDVGFFALPEADDRIEELEDMARRHGRLFVVTLGRAGSAALGGAERLRCPAEPVGRVVDTTGAGDAFAAGFLSTYCRSKDVAASLRRGARQAARAVQQVGAFPYPPPPSPGT